MNEKIQLPRHENKLLFERIQLPRHENKLLLNTNNGFMEGDHPATRPARPALAQAPWASQAERPLPRSASSPFSFSTTPRSPSFADWRLRNRFASEARRPNALDELRRCHEPTAQIAEVPHCDVSQDQQWGGGGFILTVDGTPVPPPPATPAPRVASHKTIVTLANRQLALIVCQ